MFLLLFTLLLFSFQIIALLVECHQFFCFKSFCLFYGQISVLFWLFILFSINLQVFCFIDQNNQFFISLFIFSFINFFLPAHGNICRWRGQIDSSWSCSGVFVDFVYSVFLLISSRLLILLICHLFQHYIKLQEPEKNRKLNDLLDALDFNQVVIFVKSVSRAAELNKLLVECNFPSICIHSGMSQEERYLLGLLKLMVYT